MKVIDLGSAKPDDPIYSSAVVVGGERLSRSRKNSPNKDNVVSPDVMDLKRVVKEMGRQMMEGMLTQRLKEVELKVVPKGKTES